MISVFPGPDGIPPVSLQPRDQRMQWGDQSDMVTDGQSKKSDSDTVWQLDFQTNVQLDILTTWQFDILKFGKYSLVI